MTMLARSLLLLLCGLMACAEPVRAYTEDFPPFNTLNEHGQPSGYAVELLVLLMKEAQQEYRLELVPWARALSNARQQPGSLIFTIARTPEREPHFHWIGPIAARSTAMMRLRDGHARASSLQEAKAYKVGVINGDAGMELLLSQGFVRGVNLIPLDKRNDLVRLLQLGSLDFIVASPTLIQYVASRAGLRPDQLEISLTLLRQPEGFYFALNKQSDPALLQRLQAAFERLQAREAVDQLKRKHAIE
ncbi:hypothetical protein GCM10007907_29770 [Chitinimonas prasina]|uniref:Solute-binding protein family 3/N-terminal domain-containing protein n=2 Tax=Chitinimonas prasina TaxID=1434937 RepID=A0ABQ5YKF1_9NEIS|nr:hypothetical protein GCM10007907_29770 [Chitinimonas prasina]